MQFVKSDQHSLGKIQRRVLGCRNRHDDMRAIERIVRQSVVLSPEEERDRSVLRERKHIARSSFGSDDLALRSSPPSSEAGYSHAIHERFFERIVTLNSFETVDSVVRQANPPLTYVR